MGSASTARARRATGCGSAGGWPRREGVSAINGPAGTWDSSAGRETWGAEERLSRAARSLDGSSPARAVPTQEVVGMNASRNAIIRAGVFFGFGFGFGFGLAAFSSAEAVLVLCASALGATSSGSLSRALNLFELDISAGAWQLRRVMGKGYETKSASPSLTLTLTGCCRGAVCGRAPSARGAARRRRGCEWQPHLCRV